MKTLKILHAVFGMVSSAIVLGNVGCSSTKIVDPATDACNPGTVLLAIECGSGVETDDAVSISLTRQSDGKQKIFDATLKCDKATKIEVAVADYEAGAEFDASVSLTSGLNVFRGSKPLDAKCTYWEVKLTTGAIVPDGGIPKTPDADVVNMVDASPDVKEIQVEAGVKLGQGVECSRNEHCASDSCVGGVCCENACNGSCRSCLQAQTGKENGVCANVQDGKDPRNDCEAKEAVTCGSTGMCDGAGSCKVWSNQTTCAAGSCTAEGAKSASMCDGKGVCTASAAQNCGQYGCAAGVCKTTCAGDGDCSQGIKCINSLCGGKRANGQTCGAADECSSGVCAEGVCCGSACGGLCESCLKAKNGQMDGECRAVAGGTDPDNECAQEGSCGKTGMCDGARQCSVKPAGTECASAMCASGQAKPALVCNGSGTCLDTNATACSNFKCGPTACITQCASDNDCIAGAYCDVGVCYPKRTKGSSCNKDLECSTGLVCSDEGICCNAKCSAACNSCKQSLTGKPNGECNALPVAARDTRCADQGAASCKTTGFCGAGGQCANYVDGTQCVAAACSADGLKEIKPRTCDGSGTCKAVAETTCGNGRCNAGTKQCSNVCATAAECAPSVECLNQSCGGKLNQGQACASNGQCSNGRCVDGFCCESACGGACEACSGTRTNAADGLCRAIPNGQNPKVGGLCTAMPACGQTGKCDGNKGCQIAVAGTQCAASVCSGDGLSEIKGTVCNGQSQSCPAASAPVDCGVYKCRNGACLSQCDADVDCDKLYLRCGSDKKCVPRKIEAAHKSGDAFDSGAVILYIGSKQYIYFVKDPGLPGGAKWSSADLSVGNDGYWDGKTIPVKSPFSYSYYSIPADPAVPVLSRFGVQVLGHSVTAQEHFNEANGGSYASFDVVTYPYSTVWKDLVPSPFSSTNASIDAAWVVPFRNYLGEDMELLHLIRGTTVFMIDGMVQQRVDSTVLPGAWKSMDLSTEPTWTSANAPFQGTTAPIDSVFESRGRTPDNFNAIVVFRGTNFYFYSYATNTWSKGDFLTSPVPLGAGGSMDLRTLGGPFSQ